MLSGSEVVEEAGFEPSKRSSSSSSSDSDSDSDEVIEPASERTRSEASSPETNIQYVVK